MGYVQSMSNYSFGEYATRFVLETHKYTKMSLSKIIDTYRGKHGTSAIS